MDLKKNPNELLRKKKGGPRKILEAKWLLSNCFSKVLIPPDYLNMAAIEDDFINAVSGNL